MNTITSDQGTVYNIVELSENSNQFGLVPYVEVPPPPPPIPTTFHTDTINDFFQFKGYGSFINPAIKFYQNKTFSVTCQSKTNNNRVIIHEYDGVNTPMWDFIGTGTPTPDQWNHPQPAIEIMPDGTIVMLQINGHSNDMNVWTSNTPGTISDGFTMVYRVPGFVSNSYSYPNPFLYNGKLHVLNRITNVNGGGNLNSQSLLINTGDWTEWELKVTAKSGMSNMDFRLYPHKPYSYNSTRHYFVADMHNNATSEVRGNAVYYTEDFITFKNYDGSLSKDITSINADSSEAFTASELDQLTVWGDRNDTNSATAFARGCVINNVLYLVVRHNDGTPYILKIQDSGITQHDIQVPGFTHVKLAPKMYLYSNADKLIIAAGFEDDTFELWRCDLNLGNWEKLFEAAEGNCYGLPVNYEDITGNYMMAGGREAGVFKAYLTGELY